MPPKSARAGAENWGKNWGKIPETRHKNGAANQQNCGKLVEKSAKLRFLIAASLSAPFGTKRSQVQILSPRPKCPKKPPFQYEIGGFSYAWVSLSFAMTNAMTNFAFSAPPKLHYASI